MSARRRKTDNFWQDCRDKTDNFWQDCRDKTDNFWQDCRDNYHSMKTKADFEQRDFYVQFK